MYLMIILLKYLYIFKQIAFSTLSGACFLAFLAQFNLGSRTRLGRKRRVCDDDDDQPSYVEEIHIPVI